MQHRLLEYSPEAEMFETENFEWAEEADPAVLPETEEMELASELLAIKDEQDLDFFLGKLIRGVARRLGRVIGSPAFKAIGGVLKGVAEAAFPISGRTLGAFPWRTSRNDDRRQACVHRQAARSAWNSRA